MLAHALLAFLFLQLPLNDTIPQGVGCRTTLNRQVLSNLPSIGFTQVFIMIARVGYKVKCHQLAIEVTKIYLEGIKFLLSRNSWILKLLNDVRWVLKLEFEFIGKLCLLVSWADQALTKLDSFEVSSGFKNLDKSSSWHNLSFDFVKRILVLPAIADSSDRHLWTNF